MRTRQVPRDYLEVLVAFLSCNFVLQVAVETVEMPGFSTNVTRGNFTALSGFSACQTKLAGKSNWENNGTKALREGARISK